MAQILEVKPIPIIKIKVGRKVTLTLLNPKKKRECKRVVKSVVMTRVLRLYGYSMYGKHIPILNILIDGATVKIKLPSHVELTEKQYLSKHKQALKGIIKDVYLRIVGA